MSANQVESAADSNRFVVEHEGDLWRIIVPIRGRYAPIPSWLTNLDLLGVVIAPICFIVIALCRAWRPLPIPPRAVFEVDAERFRLTLTDVKSGETTRFDWPRAAVAEVRWNPYDKGLWVDVPGYIKATYLRDLPRETIEQLAMALNVALLGKSASSVPAAAHPCPSDGTSNQA